MKTQTSDQISKGVSKRLKTPVVTFAQQAEKFLTGGANRKRNTLRPASVRSYRAQINTHLVPLIGDLTLDVVGNAVIRDVATKLSEQGLSANTIGVNVFLIKKILKDAVDENGDQLYPRTWNADIIDAPVVNKLKQPTVSAQQVQDAISKASKDRKALYALLAGTGLREAEALALKLDPDDQVSTVWIPSESKIIVRQQLGRKGLAPTKTSAGEREVDMAPELNEFLMSSLHDRLKVCNDTGELIFSDCESCYRVSLEKNGISGGFHVFRRFRVTHLKMNSVPDPLIKFWTGHAAENVTESYTKVGAEIKKRKEHAVAVGLGFELPEVS